MVVVAGGAWIVQKVEREMQRVFVPPGLHCGVGDEIRIHEFGRVADVGTRTDRRIGVAVASKRFREDGFDDGISVDPVQTCTGKSCGDALTELHGQASLPAEYYGITAQRHGKVRSGDF